MKLSEAISLADSLKRGNKFDNEIKIRWLSELDMRVADEIIRKHEDGKSFEFGGYDEQTPGETKLLIPEPYTDAYIHYLHSKMDLFNNDYERYQSSTAAFYAAYQDYAAFYNREHLPIKHTIKVF